MATETLGITVQVSTDINSNWTEATFEIPLPEHTFNGSADKWSVLYYNEEWVNQNHPLFH
jgi:hypothetical protein